MEQFLVPAGEGASEYMEKKSRFLGPVSYTHLTLPTTHQV